MNRLIFTTMMLCFFAFAGFAQQRELRGTIRDEIGEPLPGVTVIVKGTQNGTVTDIDGNYELLVNEGDILMASFVGYKSRSVTVGQLSVIDFAMERDTETLEEVVVIGYGSIDKSSVTTAISSINQEKIKNVPVPGIDQAIQGRLAGVTINSNGGQPGGGVSVRVRGITSVNNNEPLYVIDGVPILVGRDEDKSLSQNFLGGNSGATQQSVLSRLNPADIETIDVLKDASAQAIYGSMAANGVVLITTKKGKVGEGRITYDAYFGRSYLPKKLDVMNLRENAIYQNEVIAEVNAVEQPANPRVVAPELQNPEVLGRGTDWQDEIYQTGPMWSQTISFSGGQDKTNYYFSLGALNQQGILIGTSFERYSFRASVDHDIKDWLSVGFSNNTSRGNQRIGLTDAFDAVTSLVLYNSPLAPVKDANGDYVGQMQVGNQNYGSARNPVAQAVERDVRNIETRTFGAVYGDIKIIDGLTFRNELNYNYVNTDGSAFQPEIRNEEFDEDVLPISLLRERRQNFWNIVFKSYLSYNKSFAKHNIYTTLGHETNRSSFDWIQASRDGLTQNLPSLQAGRNDNEQIQAGAGDRAMESYFGRLNYSYDGRYAISGTLRADGSSTFGSENRWGYFPAISGSWTLSNEAFMNDFGFITNAKVRAGYGEVGNQSLGQNLYTANVSLIANSPFPAGSRLRNVPNPDLGWESVKTTNIGIDLGIFNNRVELSVDYFKKVTNDMFLQGQYGAFSGIGSLWNDLQSPWLNGGQMTNTGIDLALNGVIADGDFRWTSNLIYSKYKNRLDYLNSDAATIPGLYNEYGSQTLVALTQAGQPLGTFYGYVTDGLYREEEGLEALEAVDNGLDVAPDGLWYGDIRFRDLNGDTVINDMDVAILGDPNPDFTLGFTNEFSYKGFSLSVFLYASVGADIYNYTRRQAEGMNSPWLNQFSTVQDRYTSENTNATIPRFNSWHSNNIRVSDRFVEDGSYLRVQNVQLGYDLPSNWANKVLMSSAKIYVSIQNLATFTNYSGYDPELGSSGDASGSGGGIIFNVDNGKYPNPTTYTAGLNITF